MQFGYDRAGFDRCDQVDKRSVAMCELDRLDSGLFAIDAAHEGPSVVSPESKPWGALVKGVQELCLGCWCKGQKAKPAKQAGPEQAKRSKTQPDPQSRRRPKGPVG